MINESIPGKASKQLDSVLVGLYTLALEERSGPYGRTDSVNNRRRQLCLSFLPIDQ